MTSVLSVALGSLPSMQAPIRVGSQVVVDSRLVQLSLLALSSHIVGTSVEIVAGVVVGSTVDVILQVGTMVPKQVELE